MTLEAECLLRYRPHLREQTTRQRLQLHDAEHAEADVEGLFAFAVEPRNCLQFFGLDGISRK